MEASCFNFIAPWCWSKFQLAKMSRTASKYNFLFSMMECPNEYTFCDKLNLNYGLNLNYLYLAYFKPLCSLRNIPSLIRSLIPMSLTAWRPRSGWMNSGKLCVWHTFVESISSLSSAFLNICYFISVWGTSKQWSFSQGDRQVIVSTFRD